MLLLLETTHGKEQELWLWSSSSAFACCFLDTNAKGQKKKIPEQPCWALPLRCWVWGIRNEDFQFRCFLKAWAEPLQLCRLCSWALRFVVDCACCLHVWTVKFLGKGQSLQYFVCWCAMGRSCYVFKTRVMLTRMDFWKESAGKLCLFQPHGRV